MSPSPEQEPQRCDQVIELLELLQRRTRRQTTAVIALVLVVFVLAAAIFGYMVNWFAGDWMIYAGVIALTGLIAFAIGWLFGWSAGRFIGRRK